MALPFQVLILGSGSAIPNNKRNHTSQFVSYNNRHMLFDCGEGTQVRLKKYGVGLQKINHIFISHMHGDHYLGLPGLVSTMNLLGREKDLNIYGPDFVRQIIDLHFKAAGSRSSFRINYRETTNHKMDLLFDDDHVRVYSFPVKHKIPTTGFLVSAGNRKRKLKSVAAEKYAIPKHLRAGLTDGLDYKQENGNIIPNAELTSDPLPFRLYAFCADTLYQPSLKEILSGVHMMYHETSFLKTDQKKAKEHLHTTAGQAAELARDCGVGKLLIGHFSNKYNDDQMFLDEARAIFPETHIAEEGNTYEII